MLRQPISSLTRCAQRDHYHIRLERANLRLPEAGPFDGIIMTAVTAHIPHVLLEQLVVGGRIVFPKGSQRQNLCIIERNAQGYTETTLEEVNFVPILSGVIKK